MAEGLDGHGFFFGGADVAYNLTTVLLISNNNPEPDSYADAFYFWLSNSRIWSKCALGELIMRWGIFWMKLDSATMMQETSSMRQLCYYTISLLKKEMMKGVL